jgi:hypothetical protein
MPRARKQAQAQHEPPATRETLIAERQAEVDEILRSHDELVREAFQ